MKRMTITFGVILCSALNKFVDMLIEFEESYSLNSMDSESTLSSMKSREEFTFKTLECPKNRSLFDDTRQWKAD